MIVKVPLRMYGGNYVSCQIEGLDVVVRDPDTGIYGTSGLVLRRFDDEDKVPAVMVMKYPERIIRFPASQIYVDVSMAEHRGQIAMLIAREMQVPFVQGMETAFLARGPYGWLVARENGMSPPIHFKYLPIAKSIGSPAEAMAAAMEALWGDEEEAAGAHVIRHDEDAKESALGGFVITLGWLQERNVCFALLHRDALTRRLGRPATLVDGLTANGWLSLVGNGQKNANQPWISAGDMSWAGVHINRHRWGWMIAPVLELLVARIGACALITDAVTLLRSEDWQGAGGLLNVCVAEIDRQTMVTGALMWGGTRLDVMPRTPAERADREALESAKMFLGAMNILHGALSTALKCCQKNLADAARFHAVYIPGNALELLGYANVSHVDLRDRMIAGWIEGGKNRKKAREGAKGVSE